jgi:hypothetical protein
MASSTATAAAKERAVLDYRTWVDTGKHLAIQGSTSLFVIGDWLVSGMDAFVASQGEDSIYKSASESTGYGVRYLQDLCSTARRMPVTVRTVRLTFNHHRVVCNLAFENKYAQWLERAARENLSVRKLAARLKEAAAADPSLYPKPKPAGVASKKALAKNSSALGPLDLIARSRGITLDALRVQIEKEWIKEHAAEVEAARDKWMKWRAESGKRETAKGKVRNTANLAKPIVGKTWKQRLNERVKLLVMFYPDATSIDDFAAKFTAQFGGLELPLLTVCSFDSKRPHIPAKSVFGRRFGWDYQRALTGYTKDEDTRRIKALKIEAIQAQSA